MIAKKPKELTEYEQSEEYVEEQRYRAWCKTPAGKAMRKRLGDSWVSKGCKPRKPRRPPHNAKCSFCDNVWFMVQNKIRYCEKHAAEKGVDRCPIKKPIGSCV